MDDQGGVRPKGNHTVGMRPNGNHSAGTRLKGNHSCIGKNLEILTSGVSG